MSEREKATIDKLAELPQEVRDRILDRIDGAILALEHMRKEDKNGNICKRDP